jgi:hypothetical protein
LSKLEKEYQEGKQKFINEKNVEEATKIFTQENEDFGKRNASLEITIFASFCFRKNRQSFVWGGARWPFLLHLLVLDIFE